MAQSMMLLINPTAGRATSHAAIGGVVETFCMNGWHPSVFYTGAPGRATLLAAQYGGDYDVLVCLGGDGTLSETISGLMQLAPEKRPRLGYIPMGTANDVANTLNLPRRKPIAAAQDVLRGQQMPYDVGQYGADAYFTYVAAFGAFTEVSYSTDQEVKHALGQAAYVLSSISYLPKLKSYHTRIEYDGGVLEEELIFGAVSNSTSVAGMIKLDKRVVALSDGLFELVLVRTPKSLQELNSIVNGLLTQDYNGPVMSILQTSRVKFTFDEPVPWTRDGENGGEHSELEIRNLHKAVDFIL